MNDASERALILAPIGRDTAVASSVLGPVGVDTAVCRDVVQLVVALEAGAGVAVVTDEALLRDDPSALIRWLDGQPAWSDFPFVVLTGTGSATHQGLGGQRLMSLLRNVTLLERPVMAVTLTSAVQAALRARRRQYEVQAHLRDREQAEAELRGLNETLEERVAERTLRLEDANRRLLREIEDRRHAEDALRQAQKMQAVGQLTGGIAHDFNNVLTAISGNLDLLQEKLEDPTLQRMAVSAGRGVERAAKLTQQLLAFSRRQYLEPQPIDFNQVIDDMEEMLTRTVGESLAITKLLAPDLWPAMTDPHQIESALLNLVLNARDATPEGGRITIATSNVEVDRDMAARHAMVAGSYVVLAISDTGCGMGPEVIARAFEPFFTTKPTGKGTGLGLSMVYGFVRQSDGHVRIDSEEGAGTTVALYLPRATTAAAAPSDTVAPARALRTTGSGAGLKILVVEDAGDVREIAVSVLRNVGFKVVEATDATAALDILTRDPDIGLVFTDVVMPGDMTGMDLARTVVERWPSLRLILTSGYAERLAERDWLPPDVGFLRKPYRPLELLGKIRAAVQSGRAKPH